MMREPPDPLRHSMSMNLDLNEKQEAELLALEKERKAAVRRGCAVGSQEQGETASREQVEALDAVDDFWRRVAADQVPGAADELKAWNAWRAAGGKRLEVRADLNGG